MKPASEVQWLYDSAVLWEAYDAGSKVDCTSTAIQAGEGWYVFDPVPLAPDAMGELLDRAPLAAVCCTSTNHRRACEELAKDARSRLFASAEAISEFGWSTAECVSEGSELPGRFFVVELPGAAPGEIAFVHPPRRHAVLGDAVVNLPGTGLVLLPDKYCTDPRELRRSLRNLLRHPVNTLSLAHGTPLMSDADQRLESLLS